MDIYIPRDREIELANKSTVAGFVEWQVVNPDGSVAQRGAHPNLILDQGLNQMGTIVGIPGLFGACAVGTGNSTPVVAQIGLDTEVARTVSFQTGTDSGGTPYNGTRGLSYGSLEYKRTFNFAIGALNGTYFELGFSGTTTPGNNLFSRALFKDGSGNPVGVAINASQQLRVSYFLTFSINGGSGNSTTGHEVSITGVGTVGYSMRHRLHNAASATFAFGAGTSLGTAYVDSPGGQVVPINFSLYMWWAGGNSNFSLEFANIAGQAKNAAGTQVTTNATPTVASYTNNNFYLDGALLFGTNSTNLTDGMVQLGSGFVASDDGKFAFALYEFDTPILKTDQNTLTLNIRRSWGRA